MSETAVEQAGPPVGDITLHRNKYQLWESSPALWGSNGHQLWTTTKNTGWIMTSYLDVLQDLHFTNFLLSWGMTSVATVSLAQTISTNQRPGKLGLTNEGSELGVCMPGHIIVRLATNYSSWNRINYKFLSSPDNSLIVLTP